MASSKKANTPNIPQGDRRIVVFEGGWVFMGLYVEATESAPARIDNAFNIRQWGTTKGLGEIALGGPTNDTQLDDYGVVVITNPATVLFTIPCSY